MSAPYSEYTNIAVNSMVFTPEEQKAGKHIQLIKYLFSIQNVEEKERHVPNIHIWSDGHCLIVDWVMIEGNDVPFEWVPLDEDHYVCKYETEDEPKGPDSVNGDNKEQ